MQLRLHAVEGADIGQLEGQRLLAGEAHGQQGEAVAGKAVRGVLAGCALAQLDINEHGRKITGMFFRQLFDQVADAAQHLLVRFAKVLGNFDAGGGGDAVNNGENGRGDAQGCG